MNSYTLTNAAASDLKQITRHTLRTWGADRAKAYVAALHRTFENLAAFPASGRPADDLRPGCFRFESERHSIFYRPTASGVLVLRVLHQRMEAKRRL